jgi:hypothetical protein
MWEKGRMDLRKIFNWLIAFAVAAGLFVAPLSATVMAVPHSTAVADEMQAMADDMLCCPDQQDQKSKNCGSCSFVALCMLTVALPARGGAGALMDRTFSRSLFGLPDDLFIDGLGEHPPDHPPRTIV